MKNYDGYQLINEFLFKKPKQHPFFGILKEPSYDKQSYYGIKNGINFSISKGLIDKPFTIKYFQSIIANDKRWKFLISRKYLKLYNEKWRGDRPILNSNQFMSFLKLTNIAISKYKTIDASIIYNDGDLFHGHDFFIYINSRLQLFPGKDSISLQG